MSKEGLTLMCDHFVCKKCFGENLKNLNFCCIDCCQTQNKNRKCFVCQKDFEILQGGEVYTKVCCGSKFTKKQLFSDPKQCLIV